MLKYKPNKELIKTYIDEYNHVKNGGMLTFKFVDGEDTRGVQSDEADGIKYLFSRDIKEIEFIKILKDV